MSGMPATLEGLSTAVVYDVGDNEWMKIAYICPDPELTGEPLDEANLRVLRERDEAVERTYAHWSWRRYIVLLLPEADADSVRAALEEYPVLDDMVYGEVEAEWGVEND